MELMLVKDPAAVAEAGARRFAEAVEEDPALAVAVATGNSPIAMYAVSGRKDTLW